MNRRIKEHLRLAIDFQYDDIQEVRGVVAQNFSDSGGLIRLRLKRKRSGAGGEARAGLDGSRAMLRARSPTLGRYHRQGSLRGDHISTIE